MHPEVDIVRTRPLAPPSLTGEIHASSPAARNLFMEVHMRSTHLALLGLALAAAACVDVQHRHYTHDGGADGGSVARDCSNAQLVAGDLTFSNADTALLLTGVPKTGSWKLGGKLTMTGTGVKSLAKLNDLCSVGDLDIAGTSLTKLDTAAPIEVVGNLSIHDNDALTDVSNAIPGASSLGSIFIDNNRQLAKFDSFATADTVSLATTITNNAKLATIDLHQATRLEGGLYVETNAALTSLQLSSLQSAGDLTISSNTALPSVTLGALQFVHGSLTIDRNNALDLATMMSAPLQRIDLDLAITNNPALTGLGELSHTGSIGGAITISNNGQLDFCPAREVGCCVAHPGVASITNNLTADCTNGPHSWCFANNTCPYQYSNQ